MARFVGFYLLVTSFQVIGSCIFLMSFFKVGAHDLIYLLNRDIAVGLISINLFLSLVITFMKLYQRTKRNGGDNLRLCLAILLGVGMSTVFYTLVFAAGV